MYYITNIVVYSVSGGVWHSHTLKKKHICISTSKYIELYMDT